MLDFIISINRFFWSFPMLLLLFGTHVFFTIRLGFIQRKTFLGIRLSFLPEKVHLKIKSKGNVTVPEGLSGYGALMTMLAATLGTGNIIGISTAVAYGGPGAVFWCWLTGVLGMATSYIECYYSHFFRRRLSTGQNTGGPMYLLYHVLDKKIISVLYSFFLLLASLLIGAATQSNSIALAAKETFHISPEISGLICSLITGLVLMGGLKAVGNICSFLVPIMAILYIGCCFIILFFNREQVLPAFFLIMRSAFSSTSLTGGLIGGGLIQALRFGIARGLYTNEAGIGSAGIAAASAKTSDSNRQALISMTGVFWDTVIICGITGLMIVSHFIKVPSDILKYSAGELTLASFSILPAGRELLSVSLILFALSTIIGWSFYGEQTMQFLFRKNLLPYYKSLYLIMVFSGALLPMDAVWEMTDFANLILFLINIYALFCLWRLRILSSQNNLKNLSFFMDKNCQS